MTSYEAELTIDFGKVGSAHSEQPFRVRLDARALADLIRHAENAHCVYELLLIDRPGDVWDYVWVVIKDLPKRVAERVEYARERAATRDKGHHAWPNHHIPFTVFDRLFSWVYPYDADPEDEAWLSHRDTPTMRAFAKQLLATVRAAQGLLDWNDSLLRHEVARVRSGDHPYHFLGRRAALEKGRARTPNTPTHTPAFYDLLGQLLRDPDLTSVAYRADGDYTVLRMMATEQRERANKTGHSPGHALHLSALGNRKVSNDAWNSEILLSDEGLPHGDLFIEGGGLGNASIKALVEQRHRAPSRDILSARDEGNIEGFDSESGDGWVLYRKRFPEERRLGLERLDYSHRRDLGAVLRFGGQGASLFEYEKSVVVVGEEAAASVRAALASVMAEWQQHGGDPVLIVLGDVGPFEAVGCRDLLQPPVSPERDALNTTEAWLRTVLRQVLPWIDVIIALDAPAWATQVLADRVSRAERPWKPWVVMSAGGEHLAANLTIEGDAAQVLMQAHQRARAARPQRG